MANIPNFPAIRPSLLLDFANSGRTDPRIAFTRATTAARWGASGKLESVPSGVPRIDYDKTTGECLGLLLEGASTNLSYPSNMPTSTVGTTTGKMQANGAIQITSGVLAPDGSSNGFTVVGALSSGNSTGNSNIRSLAGFGVAGVYTVSCWAKSSIAGTALLVRDPSSGAIIATPSLPPVWRKYYFTFTTTVDNANAIFYNTEGNAVDLFNVQIEAGPVASSDIPTTTAAVTRAADNPVIGIQPSLKKTFIAEVNSYAGYPSASANDRRHVFSLTPETLSTSSEYIWVFLASNGLFLVGRSPDGGIFTRTLLSAFPASNASHRVGVVIDGSTFQGVLNGVFGPVQTGLMNSGNVLNTLTIGAQQSSGVSRFVLGYVARLSIYESDLPIAQVQRLTQP